MEILLVFDQSVYSFSSQLFLIIYIIGPDLRKRDQN